MPLATLRFFLGGSGAASAWLRERSCLDGAAGRLCRLRRRDDRDAADDNGVVLVVVVVVVVVVLEALVADARLFPIGARAVGLSGLLWDGRLNVKVCKIDAAALLS